MITTKCSECGADLNPAAKTCPYCGAKVKFNRNLVPCRKCGGIVAKKAQKCPHCGAWTPNKNNFSALVAALCLYGLVLVFIVTSINGSEDNDSSNRKSDTLSGSQYSELTDEEKASALLYDAAAEFKSGDYMSAIDFCKQIASEYPDTETASGVDEWLEKQYDQFPKHSAKELMSEYDANIVNADEKYTDTVMVVSGTVNSIGKINNDKTLAVMLNSDTHYRGVQLNFKTSQTDSIAELNEGDYITVIGRCTGISGTQLLIFSGDNVIIENCCIID